MTAHDLPLRGRGSSEDKLLEFIPRERLKPRGCTASRPVYMYGSRQPPQSDFASFFSSFFFV